MNEIKPIVIGMIYNTEDKELVRVTFDLLKLRYCFKLKVTFCPQFKLSVLEYNTT